MRAEFARSQGGEVVGTATWTGGWPTIESTDEGVAAVLRRVFRPVAVAVDEPALRSFGTKGPVVLQPGSLVWFEAAARARAAAEDLHVRFTPGATGARGWDPAGAYRPLVQSVERTARRDGGASDHLDPSA